MQFVHFGRTVGLIPVYPGREEKTFDENDLAAHLQEFLAVGDQRIGDVRRPITLDE